MVVPRLQTGVSDPVSYECTCLAGEEGGGTVLLFYRYFANHPSLPAAEAPNAQSIEDLASWHRDITARLGITGKIRVAIEGFNITVAGTRSATASYIEACTNHWSFSNLQLSTETERKAFFKPSPGCACVFQPATEASVRVCAEITPLGITNYAPTSWNVVEELLPSEFHRRCHEEDVALFDLRNHYESRIGYFAHPRTGDPALRPQIRRFSQWPRYFKTHDHQSVAIAGTNSQILTYCTGGIRCEKATRWMAERDDGVAEKRRISTLKGGIAAYMDWVDEEIAMGRMKAQDSLFKGKNYVFDARGATSLSASSQEPVAQCHVCGRPEDRLSKCRSPGCHLVLVVCTSCETGDPRCCQNCRDQTETTGELAKFKEMCMCEKTREFNLWGPEQVKPQRSQKSRKAKTNDTEIHIQVKMIE